MVQLLRANGARVPVTLTLSTHDDGERVQHVVRVVPSSEAARLDGQRLVMRVNQDGIVVGVDDGPTKALFGFPPQVCLLSYAAGFLVLASALLLCARCSA